MSNSNDFNLDVKGVVKKVLVGLIVVFILVVASQSFKMVPANNVGIRYNAFAGGVQERSLANGFHIKMPFVDKIYLLSTEVETVRVPEVTTQTNDAQWIKSEFDVKYQVEGDNALLVFKNFRTIDRVNNELIVPIVQKAVESVTVKYNIVEVLGVQRNIVYDEIETRVTEELEEFGLTFRSITLTDTDAGVTIEKSIEDEAVALKQVDVAKQTQAKAAIENETKIQKAEAEAKQTLIKAEAEAEANRKIAQSVTPELARYLEAQARIEHGWVEVLTSSGGQVIVDTTDNKQKVVTP